MLEVTGLTVDGLIHRIGFCVTAGERVAVVGASGSGKSLTAKALLGALPPALTATGSVRIGGGEVLGVPCDRRPAHQRPGFVPQDTSLALHPLITVGEQVAIPLRAAATRARRRFGSGRRAAGTGAVRRRGEVASLLAAVGLEETATLAGRRPGELSGGQRQRVCLAIALASRPPLIIADEPTTALDMVTQAGIVRLLRERTGRSPEARPAGGAGTAGPAGGAGTAGPALLFITHDLAVAVDLCERVIVLDDGAIVEDRPAREVVAAPVHPRTRELVEASRRASAALEGLR